MSAFGYSRLY